MSDQNKIPTVYADDVADVRAEVDEQEFHVEPGYVKHPPRYWTDDDRPALVADEGLPFDDWLLSCKDDEWTDSNNPVAAIESIIMRTEAGYFPSVKAMQWLTRGLSDWHEHQGRRTLEVCLGLKKPVGRSANMMKEANRQHVISALMRQFNVLRYGFGLEVGQCAAILAAWMTDPDWYTGSHEFKPLAEETLLDHWKQAKHYRQPYSIEETHKAFAGKDKRQAFIDQYPRWCWDRISEMAKYL